MIRQPISLLSRTGIIIGITLFIFQITILTSIIVFLLLPVVKSSAVTMAATMKMSVQNWIELPREKRQQFTQTLKKTYNFELQTYQPVDINTNSRPHEPYLFYLEEALGKQLNQFCRFFADRNNPDLFWTEFRYQDQLFELAVPLHQLGGRPHAVFYSVMLSGFILTLLSSWLLAYLLNKPINRLIDAIKQVSHGVSPVPLPETGCKELVVLAESVNIMVKKVAELLENRTIMLAGISHDLRTPLTRMTLSIEMLPEGKDPELSQQIRNDIALMNEMIGHYMELASCLTEEKPEECQLHSLLTSSINAIQAISTSPIQLNINNQNEKLTLWTYPIALKRVIDNLLGNAVRYGEDKLIMVNYESVIKKHHKQIIISITDQGSGIPDQDRDKVFRPFYRLEKSRNSKSGGSGLGLAIVSHLVEAHSWAIELNTAKEGGLTVRLSLPVDN